MPTQILLLRGVTPTGKNKVLMAPLRAVLETAGLRDVRTYIQSGNVIVTTAMKPAKLERLMHDVIRDNFGGDLTVLARTPACMKNMLEACPFKNADTTKLYFTFFDTPPNAELLRAFLTPGYTPDKIAVIGDVAYVLCATKYSDLKINNNFIERKLKLRATTRNYNTITNLIALAAPL